MAGLCQGAGSHYMDALCSKGARMEDRSRRVTPRWIAGAVLLMAVGAALALAGVTALDRNDDATTSSEPAAEPTERQTVERPDAEANPAAAELYDLVSSFADLTLHARYRVEVAARPGMTSMIDVWQKDGRVRQEAEVDGGDGTGRLVVLDLDDRVLLCQQPPEGRYTCDRVPDAQATSLEQLRTGLLTGLADQEVDARDDTIDGRAVRCFVVAAQSASELCATPDGVLVRVRAPEGSFELVELDTEVDDSVFTPPGPVGAG